MTFQNSDFEAVATFNKRGWSRYAEKMVSTFVKYWPEEVKIVLYCEDLPKYRDELEKYTSGGRVIVKDIFEECPHLKPYLKKYDMPKNRGITYKNNREFRNFKMNGVQYCYKAFAQCTQIKNSKAKKLIYVDSDTLTFKKAPMNVINGLMPNDCFAMYIGRGTLETNYRTPFPETGFHMYNLQHPNTKEFADIFENYYTSGKQFDLLYPVDCWVWDTARKDIEKKHGAKSFNLGNNLLGKKHPFVNSVLGSFMDHLKGYNRKALGHSQMEDMKDDIRKKRLSEVYWKNTRGPNWKRYYKDI